ncbi:MAG: hypothetical protein LCH57_12030 [Proteobacteria bacterium]|nr:hypothetical protein [Pseudomonadota bacterium]
MVLALGGQAAAQERRPALQTWTDPDLGGAILEGVSRGDGLWLRGASKKVVRFDRRTGERTVVADNVIDQMSDGPHLWVLVALNENESLVRDLFDVSAPNRRIYFEGSPIALFPTPEGPGVLTTTTVLSPTPDGFDRHHLAASLDQYAHVSALTGTTLYVGYNKGEWGGGLRRIDLASGTVSFVKESSDELCGGRLNPNCAPVVGIVRDLAHPNCAVVGASLAHLSGRYGEVMRVCGDDITSVFSDPLPIIKNSIVNRPGQTWPFSHLVQTPDGWVAVSQDRFARARPGGIAMGDVPPLKPWAGLQISDAVDGLVFVQSACCWGSDRSVSYNVLAIPVQP